MFDWESYIRNYADLRNAGITTREQALEHWNNYGFNENRTDKLISDDKFDWQTYLNNYADLREAGLATKEDAMEHWVLHGQTEGRTHEPIYYWQKYNDAIIDFELPQPNLSETIPRVIYQTWETLELPSEMADTVKSIQDTNPTFKYELFDENARRNFIKEYFPSKILYAYDSLIPGAYRADLWRYCIIYMNGGIYLDIKFKPIDNFSFESMIDREHYLFDWKGSQPKYGISVANGFLISYPGNPALKSCIYEIYRNVLNKFYGAKALAPTGPWLLGKYITKNQCTTVNNFDKISYNDTIIFNMYDSYRHETESHKTHYSVFWDKNDIYKDLNMLEYTLINTTKLPDVEINTVPKQIFQTWKTLDIPSDMEQNISENIQYLPEYTFYLYSDDSCREFLSEYFHPSVLRSFDTLIPGAFRADLWRYCVLYIYGGIYMDIKYKFMRECDMDTLIKSEYFVKDRPVHFRNNNGVYNGFMIVKPRNKYLFNCIATIVENVQTKYYGYNALYPTGPGLMSEIIPTNFDYKLFYDKIENDTTDSIIMNNIPLLKSYNGYRIEQKVVTPVSYDVLWHERAIYNT